MASSVALIGSKTKGKDNSNPSMIIQGSHNVYVNGVAVAYEGSKIAPHKRGKSYHDGSVSKGSSKVYVNGRPIARINDPISCGDEIKDGSSNVESG